MDFNAFAQAFARAQGRHAFGVPGGGPSLQLVDTLTRHGAQFITTGHETTAALMAGAASRQSGNPSLAITIKGPGFANLAPGLLANAYEGYAHLSLAEAYPPGKGGARKHKWLEHHRLSGEFVKAYRHFNDAPDFLTQCWQTAQSEFPGPVHIDLAAGSNSTEETPTVASNDKELKTALAAIRAAQQPALIVGSLGLRSAWREAVTRLHIPVFTTPAAKGLVSETSAFAAGIYTGDGKALTPEKILLPKADLVIALGVRSGEILNPALPGSNCLVIDSLKVKGQPIFPDNQFGSDRLFLSELEMAELLNALGKSTWADTEIASAFAQLQSTLDRWAWSPARAYQQVQALLPGATHVLDTGNFTVVGEHCLRVGQEREILGTPNGRYLGMGVGYALGASVVAGEKPVVLWIGDGGLRAFFSELGLAVEHGWKMLVLVLQDGYFGSVRGRAVSQGWTSEPLVVPDRHYARVAESMGMFSGQAANVNELATKIREWEKMKGPGLLECRFDADDYNRITELLR